MDNTAEMFKLYDIRTKHQNLTHEDSRRVITAIARYFKDSVQVDSIYIARDARLYCAELMDMALEIFPRFGIEVYFNPVQISTCQFYYSCMQHRNGGGMMITASHNPSDYVGFKLVGRDVTPIAMGCGAAGGLEQVRRNFMDDLPAPENATPARVHVAQYQREYVAYSMRLAGVKPGDLEGMQFFGEFLAGSAGTDFAMAMDIAGARFTLRHSVPDGFFPYGNPNPIEESSIAAAREIVRQGNYDMGFCFDGDGDRMDLMYPNGEQIIPGLNISLLIPYIKEIFAPWFGRDYPFKAFVDVKATPLALIEISRAGIQQHIIRNGHSFIKEKLREYQSEGYLVSEEESSHYYMNFPFDPDDLSKGFAATENSLFFTMLSARVLKENPEGYRRIFHLQQGVRRYREWPLFFRQHEAMDRIMLDVENAMRQRGATVIKEMDDGSDLDATLMRFNLPEHINGDTRFPESWCQVAQRISRSEDAMTRWEVVASDQQLCDEYNNVVKEIADSYVKQGIAYYE